MVGAAQEVTAGGIGRNVHTSNPDAVEPHKRYYANNKVHAAAGWRSEIENLRVVGRLNACRQIGLQPGPVHVDAHVG